jgi:exonuclease I
MDFRDQRLPVLATRMKARSFTHLLDPAEAEDWHDYVKGKLSTEGDWLNIADFEHRLSELEALEIAPERHAVLAQLRQHGDALKAKYGLASAHD